MAQMGMVSQGACYLRMVDDYACRVDVHDCSAARLTNNPVCGGDGVGVLSPCQV